MDQGSCLSTSGCAGNGFKCAWGVGLAACARSWGARGARVPAWQRYDAGVLVRRTSGRLYWLHPVRPRVVACVETGGSGCGRVSGQGRCSGGVFFSLEILFTLLCLATSAVDESCACAGVAGAADSLAILPALGDAQRRNAAAAPCVCIAGALRLQSWRRRRSAHGRRSTAAGRPMWRPRDEVAGPPHPRRLCGRGVGACSAGVDQ